MGKRGDIQLSLGSLIVIVLSTFVVILVISLIVGLTNLDKIKEDNSRQNMYSLVAALDRRGVDDVEFWKGIMAHPYYVSNHHIIVGFNKDENKVYDVCGEESVTKPLLCEGDSCLCLYAETGDSWYTPWGDDSDFDSDSSGGDLVDCRRLKDVDFIFTLNYSDDETRENHKVSKAISQNMVGKSYVLNNEHYTEKYSNLFIYGQCEDYWNDKDFNTQGLYVEKIMDKGKVYVFIAGISSILETRFEKLTNEVADRIEKKKVAAVSS
ncbi:hypothetical protein HYT58_01980 [Candidatus Woesearchaeota archaeon]|nr:hypothetical protein [Candidatus Woesearchaeota archaeon]